MNIPNEFKKVCQNLVQGLEVSSPEELVQVSLIGIEVGDYPLIRAFLDELLSGRYSDDQLKEIWWSMPSDMVFHESKVSSLFSRCCARRWNGKRSGRRLSRARELVRRPSRSRKAPLGMIGLQHARP